LSKKIKLCKFIVVVSYEQKEYLCSYVYYVVILVITMTRNNIYVVMCEKIVCSIFPIQVVYTWDEWKNIVEKDEHTSFCIFLNEEPKHFQNRIKSGVSFEVYKIKRHGIPWKVNFKINHHIDRCWEAKKELFVFIIETYYNMLLTIIFQYIKIHIIVSPSLHIIHGF